MLGFRPVAMTPDGFRGATFLQAPDSTNDHDLGLFEIGAGAGRSTAGRATVGLYHLAWEVDTLDELAATAERLAAAGALAGTSDHGTTKSLYGKDPDGLEFEIVWLIPADLLDDSRAGRPQADRSARPGRRAAALRRADPGRSGDLRPGLIGRTVERTDADRPDH